MSTTVVEVHAAPGRSRVTLRAGTIVPRLVARGPSSARVALVAGGALLLGGDAIDIRVVVGAGCRLELEDVGGTVAYDGEGVGATWDATAHVGDGGTLVWHGLPFVVADGADVDRRTTLRLGDGARALVRETVVLGRSGERGGVVRTRTDVSAGARPVLVEAVHIAGSRPVPGVIGRARVLDTVLLAGDEPASPPQLPAGAVALRPESGGLVVRSIGDDAHTVDLTDLMGTLTSALVGPSAHGPGDAPEPGVPTEGVVLDAPRS